MLDELIKYDNNFDEAGFKSYIDNIFVKLFTRILSTIIKILELPFKTIISFFRKIITSILAIFSKFFRKLKIKKGNFVNNGE